MVSPEIMLCPNKILFVKIYRWAFWMSLVAVLVLALLPTDSHVLPTLGWDKANHCLSFAVLSLLANLAYPGYMMTMLVSLLAYGGLIEILQSFTATRSAEWEDLFADAIGLISGLAIVWLLGRFCRRSKAESQP